MSRMRVLWLTTGYPSEKKPNVGVFHQTMVEALVRCDLDVTVITPTPILTRSDLRGPLREKGSMHQQGDIAIFRPRYLALPRQNAMGIAHLLMQFALRGVDFRRYQVVHAHFGYPMGLVAHAIKVKWGVSTVVTLHGSDVNVHPEYGPRQRRQFQRAVISADKVVAVSEALARRTHDLTGIMPEVLRTGIDTERFRRRLSKEQARCQLGLPCDSFLVLYVGNFLEAKGIRELLNALSRYQGDDVKGVFVGSGPLEPEIRDLSNAILLGPMPNQLIPTVMSAADVLVLPSYHEGLGTVLVEAGAIGVPVIASKVGGIPEVVSRQTGTLISPRSAEQLVTALEWVRSNYSLALQRAEALQSFVRRHYDVNRSAKRLAEIYHEVIGTRVARSTQL